MSTPTLGPTNQLKALLAADGTALGLWLTLETPTLTEIATVMGLDWVASAVPWSECFRALA